MSEANKDYMYDFVRKLAWYAGITVTIIIGVNKSIDAAVEKGVSNAVKSLMLENQIREVRQEKKDQEQDHRIGVLENAVNSRPASSR